MKKNFKRKSLSSEPQNEPGIADLINKVQQQLSAMEKKLDILISQPSQKPFQRFDRPPRNDSRRHDSGPREKTYTKVICADCNKECEVPFKPREDRPVYCKECFSNHRKDNPFSSNRDKRQRPAKKDKPFFARRKK